MRKNPNAFLVIIIFAQIAFFFFYTREDDKPIPMHEGVEVKQYPDLGITCFTHQESISCVKSWEIMK